MYKLCACNIFVGRKGRIRKVYFFFNFYNKFFVSSFFVVVMQCDGQSLKLFDEVVETENVVRVRLAECRRIDMGEINHSNVNARF